MVTLGSWIVGLAPAAWIGVRVLLGGLGANPIEELMHLLGGGALTLLLATLAVTPARRLTGYNKIIKARRTLGLFAFTYLTVHFLVYAVLDQGLAWSFIVEDVIDRPYITAGFAGFVLMIPLAVTSTRGWIKRLGKRWVTLHRLVYVSAALGVLHFYWRVKADTFLPLLAAFFLALLLGLRLWWAREKRQQRAKKKPRPADSVV